MKVKILSDLHLEFGSTPHFREQLDTVLVLAGDIHVRMESLGDFIRSVVSKFKHVIMVAGNHEFYKVDMVVMLEFLKGLEEQLPNFSFLDRDIVVIEDITFIGATCWPSPEITTWTRMNDSRLIKREGIKLTTEQLYEVSDQHTDYIKQALEATEGKSVVVTHFGPTEELCGDYWKGNSMNDYFWNKGFDNHMHMASLWLFGHTHDSVDAVVDGCRCVCNPYGYLYHQVNTDFDMEKTFEIFS